MRKFYCIRNVVVLLLVLFFLATDNVQALSGISKNTLRVPLGKGSKRLGKLSDYGDRGSVTPDIRDKFFGITTDEEGVLTAPDLDAGLINIPGTKIFIWDGNKLHYVKVSSVTRKHNLSMDFDLAEINSDEEEYQAKYLEDFFEEAKIKFPCYILVEIPGEKVGNKPLLKSSAQSFSEFDLKLVA